MEGDSKQNIEDFEQKQKIKEYSRLLKKTKEYISKVIVGQEDVIEKILISIIARGHVLLEGFPGLSKTLMIETIAMCFDVKYGRIQFTPDLLPSDLTGSYMVHEENGKRDLKFVPGILLEAKFLLVDEINRAPPKVHSALLQAMQEKKVTVTAIENTTEPTLNPFIVFATQNPIESEGVYDLPEAQIDRFMFKIKIDYPEFNDEITILDRFTGKEDKEPNIEKIMKEVKPEDKIDSTKLEEIQKLCRSIGVEPSLKKEAVRVAHMTREPEFKESANIKFGASPRATMNLILAAKARALLKGRNKITQSDLHLVRPEVLRHRIILENWEYGKKDDAIKNTLEMISKKFPLYANDEEQ